MQYLFNFRILLGRQIIFSHCSYQIMIVFLCACNSSFNLDCFPSKLPLREVVPRYNLVVDEDVKKPTNQPNLREVSPGETIQPYPLQIHMSTAVSYEDFPALGGFNLFLNGWARYGEDVDFKCCLLHSDSNGVIEADVFVKVSGTQE